MRQGQQNRRGRGRGRKPQNPLARSLESNGPDVKIRGTASHIAEKYSTLARDAIASGDIIMAENYYQHAEHYYRIIMAAQTQQPAAAQPTDGANGSGAQHGRREDAGDDRQASHEDAGIEKEAIVVADGEAEAAPAAANGDGSGEEAEAKPKKSAATNGGGSEQEEEAASESEDAPSKTPTA